MAVICIRYMRVYFIMYIFFFKQKTAYEMRISDWSSDVCSSDLVAHQAHFVGLEQVAEPRHEIGKPVYQRHPAHDDGDQDGAVGNRLVLARQDRKSVV